MNGPGEPLRTQQLADHPSGEGKQNRGIPSHPIHQLSSTGVVPTPKVPLQRGGCVAPWVELKSTGSSAPSHHLLLHYNPVKQLTNKPSANTWRSPGQPCPQTHTELQQHPRPGVPLPPSSPQQQQGTVGPGGKATALLCSPCPAQVPSNVLSNGLQKTQSHLGPAPCYISHTLVKGITYCRSSLNYVRVLYRCTDLF